VIEPDVEQNPGVASIRRIEQAPRGSDFLVRVGIRVDRAMQRDAVADAPRQRMSMRPRTKSPISPPSISAGSGAARSACASTFMAASAEASIGYRVPTLSLSR
jgi:hypothetical protein